ncbi:hypothetical protein TWF718_002346 [Orbilia javanica]|uniref:Uncharacterized protein n=1 Tax=Orbilia javanica TaxID=47235 RepID=A0AAN8MQQ0_9PEZI
MRYPRQLCYDDWTRTVLSLFKPGINRDFSILSLYSCPYIRSWFRIETTPRNGRHSGWLSTDGKGGRKERSPHLGIVGQAYAATRDFGLLISIVAVFTSPVTSTVTERWERELEKSGGIVYRRHARITIER